ncbi:hypothetical protein RFI_30615, partial [Reticulomyxa filosa]
MLRQKTNSQQQLADLWDSADLEDEEMKDMEYDKSKEKKKKREGDSTKEEDGIPNNSRKENETGSDKESKSQYFRNTHHRRDRSHHKLGSNNTNSNSNNEDEKDMKVENDLTSVDMGMRLSYLQKLDTEGKAKILARYLEKVPLLARLSLKDRHQLGLVFKDRSYPKGMEIIRQGDKGNEFYIIIQGEARVSMYIESKKLSEEVAVLKPGDYFGETALLTTNPRNATVRATDNVVVLVLDKDSFLRVFGEDRIRVNFGKRGVCFYYYYYYYYYHCLSHLQIIYIFICMYMF